ncbi:CGNR zinc finger domain-containing protein [Idiomarina sp.]|uniref:CGNR zinc finger domain-containing protein n=1 Tax=Idiomarina sp. TaxID=1874361 RepID=UPI003A8CD901
MESEQFIFLANNLALDFVNTEVGVGEQYSDKLESAENVFEWLHAANLISTKQPEALPNLLPLAKQLRAEMNQTIAHAKEGIGYETKCTNSILETASPYPQIAWQENEKKFVINYHYAKLTPEALLQPVAHAFLHLLTELDFSLVKQCEADDCVLMFHDQTKSHRRRWCSMALCGNRMKAAAHRKRNQKKPLE